MATKEMSKSSFYVWFLGAKESRGLRGEEYIAPVVKALTSREKDLDPIKVTLEITGKGLKIVQNLPNKRPPDNYRENIKHFIPSSSITCAVQEERPNADIVSVILLIYNPATSCPVHVHSYRCDSGETASLLLEQLNKLISQPANQHKFKEIENRLQEKGLLQRHSSSAGSSRLGSDGRSLGRGSDSGAGSDKGSQLNPSDRIATMYDSLAAELREKLGSGGPGGLKEPILLPPRDYDTMNRSRGNIFGAAEERRSLNPAVVGGGQAGEVWTGLDSGNSSGIGSQSPSPIQENRETSEDDWLEAEGRVQSEDSLILADSSWPEDRNLNPKPLSSRFFPPKRGSSPTKRSSSPTKRGSSPTKGRIENNNGVVDNPKDRFKGAKQLFLSLERKKEKRSPVRRNSPAGKDVVRKGRDVSEVRTSTNLEVKQLEGQARWSRYEKEAGGGGGQDSKWPKSDRDTGYVSRYSRDKSRSRDFDDSPPATTKQTIFTKSGKKSSMETKDKYTNNRRLSRFLSRETLESDGYDKIDEFDEPDPQRNKVKRNHSRTSLKLDMRKDDVGPEVPPGPRRGMLRREVTELDFKGYRQASNHDGFSRKYIPRQGPIWPGPKERAMSPVRALSPVRGSGRFGEEGERFHHPTTKVIPAEYRRDGAHNHHHHHDPHQRYPSLDFRNDKRKTVFESDLRKMHYEPGQDYRRRSYHELSGDLEKLDARNFQHSGRKVAGDPLGLPGNAPRSYKPLPETPRSYKPLPEPPRNYKPLPEHQRFPGLERENSRLNLGPAPYKGSGYPARSGPLPFDHPGSRPAMYRHSYAETSTPTSFARVSPSPLGGGGRFGLASLKPY